MPSISNGESHQRVVELATLGRIAGKIERFGVWRSPSKKGRTCSEWVERHCTSW